MIKKSIYIEFGKKLEAARNKAELTQEALAKRVGLSRTSITNIEKGRQRIPFHMLYLFADALGVLPKDLMPEKKIESEQMEYEFNMELLKGINIEEKSLGWVKRVIESGKIKETDNE
ncbi:MAG: helix-turn-helix domain-containing protein [Desulfobacteraceae bacterium]|nr:helix-turn-helix transcriptional regulator [Desulfobacteraceae bacterium]MBC2754330.1 helix-turn-helix domain-containing protein [Desulfobacteraceae bacterium]